VCHALPLNICGCGVQEYKRAKRADAEDKKLHESLGIDTSMVAMDDTFLYDDFRMDVVT